MRRIFLLAVPAVAALVVAATAFAAPPCGAPEPVCAAAERVVGISSFEPEGSAVVLEDGTLVTNRHMLADNPEAEVRTVDGKTVKGRAAPSVYPGDLQLLIAHGIGKGARWEIEPAKMGEDLYVVAWDVGRQAVRVYPPGRLLVAPAKTPLARLHHDAKSLPGNSGGALVDAKGRLVGIVASGGEGRNEAIPASEIARLREMSSPEHVERSREIGAAYRDCATGLDELRARRDALAEAKADALRDRCLASGNRQLFDLAAQALGQRRFTEHAIRLLEASLAEDPNAPNALISMAVTLHIAKRYAEEIPVAKRAMTILPADPQVLRLALQAGIWGKDAALAADAMAGIEKHLPQMAPAARRFYENPPVPK